MNVQNSTIVRESLEKRARPPINEATPRKRCKVSEVATLLAPQFSSRFCTGDDVHAFKWSTSKKGVCQSEMFRDAKELRAVLLTVTRGNAKSAADVILHLLSDLKNTNIIKIFYKAYEQNIQPGSRENQTKYEFSVGEIQDSVDRHTNGQGTCTRAAETFLKNVIQACLSSIIATGETSTIVRVK